jgi:flagellum-specific ATP synthase
MLNIDQYTRSLDQIKLGRVTGKLTAIHEGLLEASGCDVHQGELVEITQARGGSKILAEVVGLRNNRVLLMPFGSSQGLCLNSSVLPLNEALTVPVGDTLLGRVIDPLGNPLDKKGHVATTQRKRCLSEPINPLDREPINKALATGVKAIDVFTPMGRGQRIGIMAGSGVGKSTLLGMMAAHTNADVVVIGLIGERGREVGDFIYDCLGEEGLKKAVVVVAPAEQPAILRRQAAFTATTIAETFRSSDKNVLLIMDSITRFAMAQREIGLSTGEPMGARGYPPSVFSLLPPLLERGGALKSGGSITSVFTVLAEGDDINEPVTDHMRALLDGHVVLSRTLAARSHYPAIDVQNSISRLAGKVTSDSQADIAASLRKVLSIYASSQDMIELGAYEPGSSKELDTAVKFKPQLDNFLKQPPGQMVAADAAWREATDIVKLLKREHT